MIMQKHGPIAFMWCTLWFLSNFDDDDEEDEDDGT